MNKARKFKKLVLLNFEGPVLSAHRIKDTFVITDEWKEVIDVLTSVEIVDFINGDFSIVDSKNRSWLYSKEHSSAKPEKGLLNDFIKA